MMNKFFWYLLVGSIMLVSCSSSKSNSTNKLSDEELIDVVQRQTFRYFWEGAEPTSGAARERIHMDGIYPQDDKNVVTSGATGFGIMAIISAIDRNYVSRQEGVERLDKILNFLKYADRFHGAWPHWMHGETGKTKPFSKKDDGGDLVETAFVAQGLICVKQYFKDGSVQEQALSKLADELWKGIDFKWYTKGENVLYWHWSPNYGWEMNFPIHGYNECLIMYVLAAASPTYGVDAVVYHEGWAENGKIKANAEYKGIPLHIRHQGDPTGGPLFWAHYSYLGLNPKGLKDAYADYGAENTNQALINYQWCVDNPLNYKGYSENSWGLTASYSVKGYAGHAPNAHKDLGVIAPTAALSSIVYTPQQSIAAMRNWYENKKDKLWGEYGFYDAFSETADWYPQRYLGIDQGPIVVMLENYRSQLLWKLFMSDSDVQSGLDKLGFQYTK
ncbi:glucoamylase family protein [Pseudopedobacter sp.]|uniref:glucoamylase family protein n=1 Tax=Pseudopedobacter sp. TaxID=1936787 RepID=UPI00333EBF93